MITDPGHRATLFELREVTHHYGRVCALRELSLQVSQGAIALVGQNGAGKSTLMQILLGLIRPSRGTAWVLGQGVHRRPLALRGRIGYMPERDALVTGLTGIEYVALAGQLSGMRTKPAWRRAHETLSYLGLEEARYRRLEEFSVGMKQRLKLAAALVHDPEVLLLDEPTSGLDPEGRTAMLGVLRSLADRPDKSLLLSTHLLADIQRVCRQVVILDRGTLLHSGPVESLRRARPRRYRIRWQGPGEASWLQSLEQRGIQWVEPPGQGEAWVTVPENWTCRQFFRESLAHPLVITGLEPEEDDLESIYEQLVTDGRKR